MKIEGTRANLSTSLSLIVFVRLYLLESIRLLLFLAVPLVATRAVFFGLGSLSCKISLAVDQSRQYFQSHAPAPPLTSSFSVLSSTISSPASFARAAFTSSRFASSGITSSRVFCCFFLLLVGDASSALRLVPFVGVAAGGLELPCEPLRADWRVPAMIDWYC
jgi:hypothetical protein